MPNVLIEPAKLERLRAVVLRSRTRVIGTLAGVHQSPHFGASVEFREHKEYTPGDDLKYLDWKIFGRTDKYYVKRFEKETNLQAYLLVDASGSMDYGTTGRTKFQHAATLASSLAFLLLSQGDAVGVHVFNSEGKSFVPPKARSGHLKILYTLLDEAMPEGKTTLIETLNDLLPVARRHSLMILISDFLDMEPADLEKAVALVRQVRGDVVLFHVLDPSEESFPFHERTEFVGLEGPLRVLSYPQAIRRQYQAAFLEFCEHLRKICYSNGVEYTRLRTSDRVESFLLGFLEQRARRPAAAAV
ncbi:MAG: DUF58 domain-containing protein [Nitrospirae bacterium]|nr:DUF58 domain-containing protein [Nitrospirota bacterium]